MPSSAPEQRAVRLADFVCLQAGWFACVLGAAEGRPALGPAFVLAAVALRLVLVPGRRVDLLTLLVATALGLLTDGLAVAAGVVRFGPDVPRVGPVALWLVALWPLFSLGFRTTLDGLRSRPALASLLGLLAGPPGYLAADRLGALDLPHGALAAAAVLGPLWALALPACLCASRVLERRLGSRAVVETTELA